ncbi:hypothetical protein [Kocuria sp. CPCC 205263]|uniref:hypothetical protein n=1 Tax=Kocuria sp. CPCC 205263 TaxID=3073555 RepID=UPI0034D5F46E
MTEQQTSTDYRASVAFARFAAYYFGTRLRSDDDYDAIVNARYEAASPVAARRVESRKTAGEHADGAHLAATLDTVAERLATTTPGNSVHLAWQPKLEILATAIPATPEIEPVIAEKAEDRA